MLLSYEWRINFNGMKMDESAPEEESYYKALEVTMECSNDHCVDTPIIPIF